MIILVASRQVTDTTTVPKLGANECRIETTSRSCWEGNGSAFKTTILKVILLEYIVEKRFAPGNSSFVTFLG